MVLMIVNGCLVGDVFRQKKAKRLAKKLKKQGFQVTLFRLDPLMERLP